MSAFDLLPRTLNQAEWSGGQADGFSSNWGKKITIGLEPTKHLEKIEVFVRLNTGAGQIPKFLAADGLANLVKRLTFNFNEDGSQQPILDVTGSALWQLAPQLNGIEEQVNITAKNVTAFAASSAYSAFFCYNFNDPRFAEPSSFRTLIPLARARGTKPTLEIQLPAITELTSDASAIVPHASYVGLEVFAKIYLRDIPDPTGTYPYWRTSVKTYRFGQNTALQKEPRFILERGGVLTGILQQNFATATTRGSILTDPTRTDKMQFWYGQRMMQEYYEHELRARGDRSTVLQTWGPATGDGTVALGGYQATMFWDFVSDESLSQTLLLNSAKELTHEALDGGDCYLRFTNMKANAAADMTVLKFREKKSDLLAVTI